ncbi:MAG: HAMP domain-containing sensor histidine kinase [Candidatus Symbiobacter sp.]|nr:HAMP domain-containing sensor histidine kinase [Candidatus Symbiobacter sp.]
MAYKYRFYLTSALLVGLGGVMIEELLFHLIDPASNSFAYLFNIWPSIGNFRIIIFFAILWFGSVFGLIWTWMLFRHHYSLPISQISMLIRQIRLTAESESEPENTPSQFRQFDRHNREISALAHELEKLQKRLDLVMTERAEDRRRIETSYNAQAQFLLSNGQNLWQQLNHIAQLAESMSAGAGSLTATQYRAYCGEIKNVTQKIAQMALSMSEVSRIQSQNLILHEEVINLNQLVRDKITAFENSLRGTGIAVEYSLADDLPWLRADANRIRAIITNLLNNARKFSLPGGTIQIKVRENHLRKIEMLVQDDGVGLSDGDIERFYFPDQPNWEEVSFALPESHVTLLLVKRMVEAHGGSMKLDSQLGAGTKLLISFPNFRTVRLVYAENQSTPRTQAARIQAEAKNLAFAPDHKPEPAPHHDLSPRETEPLTPARLFPSQAAEMV